MTQLCVSAEIADSLLYREQADLFEVDCTTHKKLYDKKGVLRYVDIDWQQEEVFTTTVPLIISYHNFQETPDLEEILRTLKRKYSKASLYKISVWANTTLDSLRMLHFLNNNNQDNNLIGICMGELGKLTRICAPVFGVPIAYTTSSILSKSRSFLGQLCLEELLYTYHFPQLNRSTLLFGLIGKPVSHSLGHLFHNDHFRKNQINALYVKMEIDPQELSLFFTYISQLPFEGISVTTPLKEKVLPFLDEIESSAKQMKSVNTLLCKKGKRYGYNTDGRAALDLLGPVKNQTLLILGAGGVARAVAHTALKRRIRVLLFHKDPEKSKKVAAELGCNWVPCIPTYDCIFNTTTSPMPISPQQLIPFKMTVDFSIKNSEFLRVAKQLKCPYIDGVSIYLKQALFQQELWFSRK